MHVNVNMIRCRRVKKMVNDNLAGNFIQEFALSWDYADELRLKNPRSTIKMTVNRVTPESPPHFKRFYVCFEALKKRLERRVQTYTRFGWLLFRGSI
ncbi:hypothetical protein Goari_010114 [Gossypium aridum]|uniref:Uncharacterized protein n=1 Tax=Gossypium aridum TaxID=34290 RepID=A0A7J8XZE2_GOSAI|nr:hypothetical protein [Gossypium aridum]